MASPSSSLATLRPDLVGAFQEFDVEANQRGFVGLRAFPVIEVALPSDNPGKITLESLLKTEATERAPGAHYARGKFDFTTWTYATVEHGFEMPIDDSQRRRYRFFFDLEVNSARAVRDRVLRNLEIRIAAIVNAISTSTAAGTAWSSWSSATPIANVVAAKDAIRVRTGYEADTLILTPKAFDNVSNCAEVTAKLTASGAGKSAVDMTTEDLAKVFGLRQVLVAGGLKNSANEKQSASLANIWGNTSAKLIVAGKTNDPQEPCYGRTFHYSEDGSSIGATLETYRDEEARGDVVRARMETDEVEMYAEMGQLITGVLAS